MAQTYSTKITGDDIFDRATIAAAFKRYKDFMKDAKRQTDDLKHSIVSLNQALASGETGSYNRKLRQLHKTMKQVHATNKKLRAEQDKLNRSLEKQKGKVKKLRLELTKLKKAQKGATKGTGSLLKGFAGLGSILGALGIVGFADVIVSAGKATYETAKALDTMNLTLGKVTESAFEFARSQEFIAITSEKFGLNLLKTSSKFATFRASAKESNFTLKETMDIFETFSNAGASLGKSSAELDRIFLALEQMMSKGKVSSEELRRQLGEVLPGAVSIMAKSMGVSNAELEKMLKKGEVLASDVLPKYAEEIKKTFSLDNSERVETMAANQERLTNSMVEFVAVITKDGGVVKTWIDNLFEGLAGAADEATRLAKVMSDDGTDGVAGAVKLVVSKTAKFGIVLLGIFGPVYEAFRGLREIYGFLGDSVDENMERINKAKIDDETILAYDDFRRVMQDFLDLTGGSVNEKFWDQFTDWEGPKKTKEEFTALIDYYSTAIKNIKAEQEKINKDPCDEKCKKKKKKAADDEKKRLKKMYDDYVKEFEKYKKKILKLLEEESKRNKDAADMLTDLKIGNIKDDYEREVAKLDRELFLQQEALKDKEISYKLHLAILFELDEKYDNDREALRIANSKGEVGLKPGEKKPKAKTYDNPASQLFKTDDATLGQLQEDIEDALNMAQDYAGSIIDIFSMITDSKMMLLDEEQDSLDSFYKTQFKLYEDDADMIDKLNVRKAEDEARIEKKRKKLEYEKAKQKKAQALVDAAINIALAITSMLTAGIPGIVLAAIAAAIGVIQIAAIAAQPLPKYAMGTDNHPGGPAILGDGGKKELAISPTGGLYISGSRPEIKTMERGTKVIPDAQEYIRHQVIKSVLEMERMNNDILVDKVADAVILGFEKTRIKNENNVTVNSSIGHEIWRANILMGDS